MYQAKLPHMVDFRQHHYQMTFQQQEIPSSFESIGRVPLLDLIHQRWQELVDLVPFSKLPDQSIAYPYLGSAQEETMYDHLSSISSVG